MSFGSFLAGLAIGGVSVFGSLSYHFVRTSDGVEFVPKASPTFAETYLDVRNFVASDWTGHKTLAAAIVKAKKDHIFQPSVQTTAAQAIAPVMPQLPAGFENPDAATANVARSFGPLGSLSTR
ncbi:MAG TPA: hypothetical protein VG713_13305, partial [Pirellulales bacterium]|nr:hypothetical protein [Pirellulales bacterium]